MPKCSLSSFLPYLIITFTCLFYLTAFSAPEDLTALQKQARDYREKGWQLQKENELEEALVYYQKAILTDPGYPLPYNDAGVILEALGQAQEAKKLYIKAIEMDPDYPNTYTNLALLYENERDYANAILCWIKRANLGGPADPWAEVARRRLEDIARAYPEAYNKIGSQNRRNP